MGAQIYIEYLENSLFWGVYLIYALVVFALPLATYVLQSLGLYKIAKNRGIKKPWLAWLPIGESWILGSISDQYRYVAKGEITNRRKALLWLYVVFFVIYIALFAVFFSFVFSLAFHMVGEYIPDELPYESLVMLFVMLGLLLVMLVAAIVLAVFRYIALYDLYKSCDPGDAAVFLVLSILFSVLMPLFIFFMRNKEGGMPPRREAIPEV